MRKDAKYGLAIGAAIVAVAGSWMAIAKLRTPDATPFAKLMAATPATQPTHAPAAPAAIRYYRDRADNLLERSGAAKPTRVAENGLFVTCLAHPGRAYAILDGAQIDAESVKIIRCAADSKFIASEQVTDENLSSVLHIDSMILLPTGHLFIEGEICPSLGIGLDVGKKPADHHCYLGDRFTWNAAGTCVAYFRDPPDAPPEVPSEVWIDGRPVRQIPQGRGNTLHWEPNGVTLDVKLENGSFFRIDARTAPAITSDFE